LPFAQRCARCQVQAESHSVQGRRQARRLSVHGSGTTAPSLGGRTRGSGDTP
jgi:hypothetical protein